MYWQIASLFYPYRLQLYYNLSVLHRSAYSDPTFLVINQTSVLTQPDPTWRQISVARPLNIANFILSLFFAVTQLNHQDDVPESAHSSLSIRCSARYSHPQLWLQPLRRLLGRSPLRPHRERLASGWRHAHQPGTWKRGTHWAHCSGRKWNCIISDYLN